MTCHINAVSRVSMDTPTVLIGFVRPFRVVRYRATHLDIKATGCKTRTKVAEENPPAEIWRVYIYDDKEARTRQGSQFG